MTEQQRINREFDHESTKDRVRWGILAALFVGVVLAFFATIGHAATTVTRQGGTSDFACCEDANCDKPIGSQYSRDWAAKDACQALTEADGKTRYFRQWAMRIEKVGAPPPPPPPTCPPKPADETQPGTCPVGTTGTWTQTRTYSSAAAPTCWVVGAWAPTDPPTGACVATPPPTPSAPANLAATVTANQTTPANSNVTLTWSAVAGAAEYEVWRCAGATCTNFAFVTGADVAGTTYTNLNLPPGVVYRYRVRVWKPTYGPYSNIVNVTTTPGTVPPPPPAVGSATIDWQHDGANVAGFRILYGASSTALVSTVSVPSATVRQFKVDNLPAGTWYFAVRAYSGSGESENSNVASKVIAP